MSPVFAVKTRYATDQKVKAHPFPSLQMRYIVLYSYYDRYTTTDVVTTGDTPTVNIWHAGKATISSDVIRGYNDTIILYLLLDRPSYGYEISRMIRQLSDGKYVIKETTLYSAFTRMEKNGYIVSFSRSAENGKRRTYYSITDAGREYYREKCEEWNLTKEVVEHFISVTGTRALTDGGAR